MTKKLKDVMKKNPEPAKGTNVDPGQLGQYSAKYQVSESAQLDQFLSARGINPKFVSKDTKIAHSKSNEFKKWVSDHKFDEDITIGRKGTDNDIRSSSQDSPTLQRKKILDKSKKHYEIPVPTGSLKKEDASNEKRIEKKVDKLVKLVKTKKEGSQMTALTPESVELDEAKMTAAMKLSRAFDREKAKSTASIQRAKEMMDKIKQDVKSKSEKPAVKEDVGDAKAATNADGLPNPQLEPVSERKKAMSKSANIIKSIYKKHKVVKEDMYDHEKEDKSVASYGKKPKMDKADKKDSEGEKKPAAAATLTGGTTLTGSKRDDLEIDPMMRNRPGQPDVTKKDDKKKDDKKKEEKK